MTWTEDRAPVGTDPSAVPGAKTEGWAVLPQKHAALPSLRDWHQSDKSQGVWGTGPPGYVQKFRFTSLSQRQILPFHAEPKHHRKSKQYRFRGGTAYRATGKISVCAVAADSLLRAGVKPSAKFLAVRDQ